MGKLNLEESIKSLDKDNKLYEMYKSCDFSDFDNLNLENMFINNDNNSAIAFIKEKYGDGNKVNKTQEVQYISCVNPADFNALSEENIVADDDVSDLVGFSDFSDDNITSFLDLSDEDDPDYTSANDSVKDEVSSAVCQCDKEINDKEEKVDTEVECLKEDTTKDTKVNEATEVTDEQQKLIDKYQRWVDFDLNKFGDIQNSTKNKIDEEGLEIFVNSDNENIVRIKEIKDEPIADEPEENEIDAEPIDISSDENAESDMNDSLLNDEESVEENYTHGRYYKLKEGKENMHIRNRRNITIPRKRVNESILVSEEVDLEDFDFWGPAVETAAILSNNGDLDAVQDALEDIYPNGIGRTELNDIFAYDTDSIANILGYDTFEEYEAEREGEFNESFSRRHIPMKRTRCIRESASRVRIPQKRVTTRRRITEAKRELDKVDGTVAKVLVDHPELNKITDLKELRKNAIEIVNNSDANETGKKKFEAALNSTNLNSPKGRMDFCSKYSSWLTGIKQN